MGAKVPTQIDSSPGVMSFKTFPFHSWRKNETNENKMMIKIRTPSPIRAQSLPVLGV